MGREIKFRVWDKQRRKWLKEQECKDSDILTIGLDGTLRSQYYSSHVSYKSEDYVIQQFTGLLDDKGAEIYDGDIVSWSEYQGWEDGRTFHGLYQVVWDEEYLRYNAFDPFEGNSLPLGDTRIDHIVGNIFEHRELIFDEP